MLFGGQTTLPHTRCPVKPHSTRRQRMNHRICVQALGGTPTWTTGSQHASFSFQNHSHGISVMRKAGVPGAASIWNFWSKWRHLWVHPQTGDAGQFACGFACGFEHRHMQPVINQPPLLPAVSRANAQGALLTCLAAQEHRCSQQNNQKWWSRVCVLFVCFRFLIYFKVLGERRDTIPKGAYKTAFLLRQTNI